MQRLRSRIGPTECMHQISGRLPDTRRLDETRLAALLQELIARRNGEPNSEP